MSGESNFDAYRRSFDGAAISTYVLMMLTVPAKIWCRKQASSNGRVALDDILSIVSLVFANVFFYLAMIGIWPHLRLSDQY